LLPGLLRAAKDTLPASLKTKMRGTVGRVYGRLAHATADELSISDDITNRLNAAFRPDFERLACLTGVSVPAAWASRDRVTANY